MGENKNACALCYQFGPLIFPFGKQMKWEECIQTLSDCFDICYVPELQAGRKILTHSKYIFTEFDNRRITENGKISVIKFGGQQFLPKDY